MIDLLQKFNLNKDELTNEEMRTLETWQSQLAKAQMTVKDLEAYIEKMIFSVEQELTGYSESPTTLWSWLFRRKKHRFLMARLRNYVLLRDFLTAPERARSYVEKHIQNLAKNIEN